MREIARTDTTIVYVTDEPDPNGGGTCHRYEIHGVADDIEDQPLLCTIKFQQGAVKEHGKNGIRDVDLLKILRHRYDWFQMGPFSSATNEVIAGHIGGAIEAEATRTRRRLLQGVEGRDIKAKGVEA